MKESIYLNEFTIHTGRKIIDWDFLDIEARDEPVRLYFNTRNEGSNRFEFAAVVLMGTDDLHTSWYDECSIECLFEGTAFFDGVRHLYMGDRNTPEEGYIYYPDLTAMMNIFKAMADLESSYCSEYQDKNTIPVGTTNLPTKL